jgi:hypothetical protein
MTNTALVERLYELATKLWFRFVNAPGGHPGIPGPAGGNEPWDATTSTLEGAVRTLEEVLAQPEQSALNILRRLDDADAFQVDTDLLNVQEHDKLKKIQGDAEKLLENTKNIPDPIQTLRDLFDAGGLDDHFYRIRDSEGQGWEGPRMLKWGKACENAHKLMDNSNNS